MAEGTVYKLTDMPDELGITLSIPDNTKNAGTYTVEKRPITITIADKRSAYGCELAELGWKDAYTGDEGKLSIVNDDGLGIELITDA